MLLNEFLKEHNKVEEQQTSIRQLKSEMQTMIAQFKEQAEQIQKVSAQLQTTKVIGSQLWRVPVELVLSSSKHKAVAKRSLLKVAAFLSFDSASLA